MRQETPTVIITAQSPFDVDGAFNVEKAIDLALERRTLGDIDAADALDLLVDFFMTSQNYIFNTVIALEQELGVGTISGVLPGEPI